MHRLREVLPLTLAIRPLIRRVTNAASCQPRWKRRRWCPAGYRGRRIISREDRRNGIPGRRWGWNKRYDRTRSGWRLCVSLNNNSNGQYNSGEPSAWTRREDPRTTTVFEEGTFSFGKICHPATIELFRYFGQAGLNSSAARYEWMSRTTARQRTNRVSHHQSAGMDGSSRLSPGRTTCCRGTQTDTEAFSYTIA